MATIYSFEQAKKQKQIKDAQQAELEHLQKTFPYILIESCVIADRPIDWKDLKRIYGWNNELIEDLQKYAAQLPKNTNTTDNLDILGDLLTP